MMTLPVNAVDTVGTLGNEYNKSNTMIIAETNCPLKYYDNSDINKFKKNNKDKWKNLNAKEKNACETLIQLREQTKKLTTKKTKKTIANTPAVTQLVIVLIVVSIFILFVFGEPIRKIINSKTSNKKGKQQESKIKTVIANAKPTQSEKAKPKKEILTWDEPLKPEPKKEEPIKEEPAKEEPQPEKVTITADEEEEIYAKIGRELKENRNEGAWLKVYTECDGDEQKAKIAYINNRAKTLMEELKKKKKENNV